MTGDAPTRKPATAAAPSTGFIPKTRLAPPSVRATPEAVTAASGMGDIFRVHVLRQGFALDEMVDSVIEEKTTEDEASEVVGEFHQFVLREKIVPRRYDSRLLDCVASLTAYAYKAEGMTNESGCANWRDTRNDLLPAGNYGFSDCHRVFCSTMI